MLSEAAKGTVRMSHRPPGGRCRPDRSLPSSGRAVALLAVRRRGGAEGYLVSRPRPVLRGTFAAELSAVSIVEQSGRFVVSYAGRCEPQGGDLRYEVDIVGDATGRLTFRSWGVPVRDFVTNRTGFVVLHPLASLAGAEVELEHTDGRDETVRLPEWISPHEPAQDLFALTHRTRGLTVRVEMTGDAYDMEDQRNWTDASFKTYIRPLSKPKPYTLAAGERFEQSVTVIVSGKVDRRAAAEVRTTEWMTLPEIGLATETPELPVERFAWLKHLIGRPSAPGRSRRWWRWRRGLVQSSSCNLRSRQLILVLSWRHGLQRGRRTRYWLRHGGYGRWRRPGVAVPHRWRTSHGRRERRFRV